MGSTSSLGEIGPWWLSSHQGKKERFKEKKKHPPIISSRIGAESAEDWKKVFRSDQNWNIPTENVYL